MSQFVVGSWSGEPQSFHVDDLEVGPWKHPWLGTTIANPRSDAGVLVTPETALQHTPIWHGLLLLGGDTGSLNLVLKQKVGQGSEQDNTNHVAYKVASVRPNEHMAPSNFWEMMLTRAVVWGNAVCEIVRAPTGRPVEADAGGGMLPLDPTVTGPWFDEFGTLWIRTRDIVNGVWAPERVVAPKDTLHIKNLPTDGFWGRRIVDVGKERIASGLALQEAGNRNLSNGMKPDFHIGFPMELNPEDREEFEETLEKRNRGVRNRGRTLVTDNDAKVTQLGMTFEDAQFIELVKQDIVFAASLLGMPANMLNAMVQMTFSNSEQAEMHYLKRTLRRWLRKIEEELHWKLLTPRERDRFRFHYDIRPLLLTSLKERFAAYSQGISSRILNPNEVRKLEGLNPYEGGDEFLNPFTTIGGGPEEEEEEEEQDEPETPNQKVLANQIRHVMQREDTEVSRACKREKNVLDWMQKYYRETVSGELSGLVSNDRAVKYASDRYKMWLTVSGHVTDSRTLSDIVRAQKQTAGDRVAGLLNGVNHV